MDVGLPFGPKPRLVLYHLNAEALRTQSPLIELEDSLTAFVRRTNEELARLAAEDGVPLIDVAGPITEHAELFADRMHLNDQGERRHAEVVVSEAQRLGLFGLAAPPAVSAGAAAGEHR